MVGRIALEPLPPADAITYFRSKGFAPQLQRFSHLDHWREDHARNFVVAKGMRDDVLELLQKELLRSMEEGRTLEQFQADLEPALQKAGWWGQSVMRDPVTGIETEVQLGSMHRLRTIYDTNMRTAHAAGHWARIQRTKRALPYLHYIQVERTTKRDDHARFHDKIWHVDDPIWQIIYPPNGYFCGCHVIQRTEGWLRRKGRTVSDPMDLEAEAWTNPRTGETTDLPRGVTPGFDANPGAVWLDLKARVAEVMPDLDDDRQAHERGMLQALRLRRMTLGRETLAVADVNGDAYIAADADPERPGVIDVSGVLRQDGGAFQADRVALLHSHLTESPLSRADLMTLRVPQVRSVVAITPEGSIWRARPAQEMMSRKVTEFSVQAKPILLRFSIPLSKEDRAHIINHALALFLERRGAIHYTYSLTGRMRRLFATYADLIERLSQ
jgi:SPP1 gp7 family putative phage head morphogenesis protein